MRCGGTLAQHSMGLLRDILDLHARHGAIMALGTPVRNRATSAIIPSNYRLKHAGQPEQVQLTVPDSVGFPGLTAVALAKVKVPEPLASMVTETLAFGDSGS